MSDGFQKKRLGSVRLVLVLIWVAGGFSSCSDPYRTTPPLDVTAYRTSANSLKGNSYKLEGEVMNLLAWSPSGRLIAIGLDNGTGMVPVLLTNEFNATNIQKGQKLKLLVLVEEKGILRSTKLDKQ